MSSVYNVFISEKKTSRNAYFILTISVSCVLFLRLSSRFVPMLAPAEFSINSLSFYFVGVLENKL